MRRNTIRISGVVVCQDNASTLGMVLASLAPHCDELVVVDGGSRDATPEIAAGHPGVRLFRRDFDGNLSRQKNFAFERCRGAWILLLDTDELLGLRGAGALRRLTRFTRLRWFSLPRYWLVQDGDRVRYLASPPYYRDPQVRLFRNCRDLRYAEHRTPIHHQFVGRMGRGRHLSGPHVFHYDFLLRDRRGREAKVARYLSVDPAGAPTHRVYLWEELRPELRDLPEPLPGVLAAPRPGLADGRGALG